MLNENELIRYLKAALDEVDKQGVYEDFQLRFDVEWLRKSLADLVSETDFSKNVIEPLVRKKSAGKQIMPNDAWMSLLAGIKGMAKQGDFDKMERFLRIVLDNYIEIH